MFIKLRDKQLGKWWYVFEVSRMTVTDTVVFTDEYKLADFLGKAEADADLCIINNFAPTAHSPATVRKINCIVDRGDGVAQKEYTVIFDGEAYLCDSSGKTVEKLTPSDPAPHCAP